MLTLPAYRYGLAIVGVAAAMGLRLALEVLLGSSLPPYITFYLMVGVVVIVAGLGPGLLATTISAFTVIYWILPPIGHLTIDSPIDQVKTAVFLVFGLVVSVIAEIYQRKRYKANIPEREALLRSSQKALRESEERFQVMVNSMPQLGWVARSDGYITWYNERWYEYTGTTPEQMEGWGWQIVHDTLELPKVLDRWKTSIATGNPFEMTFPLRGADGNFRLFLTRVFPLKDAAGCVMQWFGTNTDVEEQSRAEMLLRESEARYRSLIEQATDGIFLANSQGHYIDVNSEGCKMLGYSREEVLNLTLADVLDPAEIPLLGPTVARLAEGELVVSEWQFLRKDGSVFFGEVRGRQLTNGNLQGILIDITERKKAEMLLAESEKQHRTLFENMLDGYAHCRILLEQGVPQDFIYLNVNKQFEKLTGLKNVIGKRVSEVTPGIRDSNPELFEIYGRVALTGKPEKFETYLTSLEIWFSITVYSNAKEEVVAVLQDITESKKTEQEMIILNNLLTHEVDKRTSELSALTAHVQEVAEIERANLARELHDELGSTLVGISMEVGRLRGKTYDNEHLQDLAVIKDLVSNAAEIKRRVVSQLYPTILDTYGFVAAVKWLIQEYRTHSGIVVELILPKEDVVMEQTFAMAAYRITQECLTNIAKHAGASMVHVEVKSCDSFLDLTLHDNGKGFSGGTKIGGHGIFGMIERARYLGGSMEVGSEEGRGTTAHLRIPMAAAKPKNRKRVLVVDDHAIVRNALRQLLEGESGGDFSVEGEAADGKDAVKMAIEAEWDIMLLDISLPKKNGLKVLEEIMAVKSNLPVIMLSSHAKDEYGEIALSKGAACYIEKGETSKLVEAMRRATLIQ
jgi:PAS domain S-box-containing protein